MANGKLRGPLEGEEDSRVHVRVSLRKVRRVVETCGWPDNMDVKTAVDAALDELIKLKTEA